MKSTFSNSFILSKIDYCANIWGGASKQAMDKILKMQKRAARIVLNMDMDTPSASMFNKLKWMTVYQRVRYKNLLSAYEVSYHFIPIYLSDPLSWKICNHQYNLRLNLLSFVDLNVPDV